MTTDGRPQAEAAAQVLDLGSKAATAYGRADLAERLATSRRRLEDPDVAVMVVGEFKQGKSTLVNALLNIDACAVDDDIATAIPTLVRYGEEASASARFAGAPVVEGDGAEVDPGPSTDQPVTVDPLFEAEPEPVGLDDVHGLSTATADVGDRSIRSVELTVNRKLLAAGLAIVDTPGVGGLASEHGAVTLGALPAARAVLFVSDASQELTQPELDFLRRAHQLCPHVALVITKADLYPSWDRIAELDRGHLAAAGLSELPVITVSSLLRIRAVAESDADLNRESGYGALVSFLRTDVLERADELGADAAGRDVVDVCRQLAMQFESEREVLADPSGAEATLAELSAAEGRAEALRSGASRWQTTLNDGIQDLNANVDHDLRNRFREVNTVADERLDEADPLDVWDEFEPWMRHLVAEQVAENHRELINRADELSATIAELFAADAEALGVGSALVSPLSTVEQVQVEIGVDASGKAGVIANSLGVLRGGYGGMMMFGMLAGMAGLTLAAPLTVGIGLVMGKKQQKDEKVRQLTQRRQQAKQAYRKYVDAVNFAVSKESREQLRLVHRELRDGWAERAQELQASAQQALSAAQQAAKIEGPDRERRLADLTAELERIGKLEARALLLRTVPR